jgi:hypothetical protein
MVIEISKHTKNIQSRTEIQYVSGIGEPWYLALETPDPALALYLTWHKLGCQIPVDFTAACVKKIDDRRVLMEDGLRKKLAVDSMPVSGDSILRMSWDEERRLRQAEKESSG